MFDNAIYDENFKEKIIKYNRKINFKYMACIYTILSCLKWAKSFLKKVKLVIYVQALDLKLIFIKLTATR